MNVVDIVRAWKDADYRATMSEDQRATMPPHPAGALRVLDDDDLETVLVVGGQETYAECPTWYCTADSWCLTMPPGCS